MIFSYLFALASISIVAAPIIPAGQDLSPYGFDVSIDELFELLSFQRSARLDNQAKIEATWLQRYDKVTLRELEKSENRYVYAVDPLRKRQIIAIRGTANLMNALLDLESWKDKSPVLGIRLHHGFERAATLVFEDVRSYLDPKLPIVVCCHSPGATESIIVGMLLTKAGYKVEKIVASGVLRSDGAGVQGSKEALGAFRRRRPQGVDLLRPGRRKDGGDRFRAFR